MGNRKQKNNVDISSIIQKYEKEKQDIITEYENKIKKMEDEHKEILNYNMKNIIDTMQTEFIYELASQMNYWNMKEDTEWHKYTKQSAKYRIEEIFHNIFKTIDNYSKMSSDKQVQKIYKIKKNKILNEFNLNIDE